jgi:hypothetical protein
MLTKEKVPPPDNGRYRKSSGVRRLRSEVWYAATVNAIARNSLLAALAQYGRRSMGDKLRFSKDGPRELVDHDYRDDNKPKVIINPVEKCIITDVKFEPLISPAEQQELIHELDRRGGSQRGKPRSRTPGQNPMGTRIFDLNCGWTMYRQPYNGAFRYTCGLYQQSHGQHCRHNHVDGVLATRFALSCIRQKLLKLMPQVEQRLREFAAASAAKAPLKTGAGGITIELQRLQDDLKIVSSNLARAKSDEQYQAVSTQFDQLKTLEKVLQIKLAEAKAIQSDSNAEIDVKAVVGGLEKLLALASDEPKLQLASEAIRQADAKLFLAFSPVAVKKRTLNRIAGGVVTLGNGNPPIEVYQGPTARDRVKPPSGTQPATESYPDRPINKTESPIVSDREGKSLGNVSRADWIRTSDLLTPSGSKMTGVFSGGC